MNNLEMAIQMEIQGKTYYQKQAECFKGTSMELVFTMMAEDEMKHSEILKKRFQDNENYALQDNNTLGKSLNLFNTQWEEILELREIPDQQRVYRQALENEKKSIDLYKSLFEQAKNDQDKELFEFLIKEEMNHHNILDEIVMALTRAEDWIESAEFGKRKEY